MEPAVEAVVAAPVITTTLTFAIVFGALVVATYRVTRRWATRTAMPAAASVATAEPVVTSASSAGPRADDGLVRDRRSPLAGGVLIVLPAFASADGRYDLILHLHGNTDVVEESLTLAKLNAVAVILNLGNGSGHYEERFANPMSLTEILDRTRTTLDKRGLAHAELRRLAVSAWSAGYGGVLKILDHPATSGKVDAVLLMDGIHVGYKPDTKELALDKLAPFTRFAEAAVAGKKLFVITHTQITPEGHYAGTRETTDALLAAVGVPRKEGGDPVTMPELKSVEGVIARAKLRPLVVDTIARREGLIVRGYKGDQPEDHTAQFVHMAVTVVPDLIAWWNR